VALQVAALLEEEEGARMRVIALVDALFVLRQCYRR
jgi:hypothetical protein